MRLAASCSTLLGGAAQAPPADFASLADAGEALPQVVGQACRQAAEAYASAMRLQVRGLVSCLMLGLPGESPGTYLFLQRCLTVCVISIAAWACQPRFDTDPVRWIPCRPAVHVGRGRAAVDR